MGRKHQRLELRDEVYRAVTEKRGVNTEPDEYARQPKASSRPTPTAQKDNPKFSRARYKGRIIKGNYDSLSGKDLLLILKDFLAEVGQDFPVREQSKEHFAMCRLKDTWGSELIYFVMDFLFHTDQKFVAKETITDSYIRYNMKRYQEFARRHQKGEDWSNLTFSKKTVKTTVCESKFDRDEESEVSTYVKTTKNRII